MKGLKKLKSRKGETLVEILVAVLIVALSASLFATMYSASASIDDDARKQDEDLYKAVDALESVIDSGGTGGDTTGHQVQYTPYDELGEPQTPTDVKDVEFFTQDGISVYKATEGGGS